MQRSYKECDICKRNISKSNYSKHIEKCNGELDYWAKKRLGLIIVDDSIECKFCKKINKNSNSNRNHQRLCKLNPDKQFTFIEKNPDLFSSKNGNTNYLNNSNIYIKAKKLGLPKPIISKETRIKIGKSGKNRSDLKNKEMGKKVSETITKKMLEGKWHTYGNGKYNKKYVYNGLFFDSSWEMKYAMWLDCMEIKWERCKNKFPYIYNNKNKYYIPDFFLLDTKEYIEIKGLKTDRDEEKWKQFPKDLKLKILMESDLKELNII